MQNSGINSNCFRRLQELRQLGLCYLSFPGGNHTRFEHSIGTYYLANIISKCIFNSPAISNMREQERLSYLLQLSALCHDIGHGPFSHMTENVLLGLGAKISHEKIGAAIISNKLNSEFKAFHDWDIHPKTIGSIITKSVEDDQLSICAVGLISSDLDLDRLEYLHRDLHYSGVDNSKFLPTFDLPKIWEIKRFGESLYFELTEKGISYSEKILFLRRNNYQRIVFESNHMSATAMFEKAMYYAAKSNSWIGNKIQEVVQIDMNWKDEDSVNENFPKIWELYGLVDYQAINLLENAGPNSKYLIQRIRRGQLYEPVRLFKWQELHYLVKQKILQLKTQKKAYDVRRRIEKYIADIAGIDDLHIVVDIPQLKLSKPLLLGTIGGQTLEDLSALGSFFSSDLIRQYKLEIFIDSQTDHTSKKKIFSTIEDLFKDGNLNTAI